MPKLTPSQMRALRLLDTDDVYTPADREREAAIAKSTAYALQTAGYATIERLGRYYGEWKVSITRAGRDKICPPPEEPGGVMLAHFLISSPDYSTNTESGAEALTVLASMLHSAVRWAMNQNLADQLLQAQQKVLGRDPDHTKFPVSLRFMDDGFRFYDFSAQRCAPREED